MVKNKTISVIIAAGGNSSRFGKNISKQFVLLNGKPLIFYSLEKLAKLKNLLEIVIVTSDIDGTSKLIESYKYLTSVEIRVVNGGELRQESVYNGFCKLDSLVDLVLIHDVARPLFDIRHVEHVIEKASLNGAAVLAVPVVDTVKETKLYRDELTVERTLNRDGLFLVQTPQVVSYNLLSEVYRMLKDTNNSNLVFTDEASMLEFCKMPVTVVVGDKKNIKITYEEDLEIASAILNGMKKKNLEPSLVD